MATVVARTSTLREDPPVAGDAQVVQTWSDTATTIARKYRCLGGEFTAADVHGWEIDVTDGSEGGARFEITGVEFIRG